MQFQAAFWLATRENNLHKPCGSCKFSPSECTLRYNGLAHMRLRWHIDIKLFSKWACCCFPAARARGAVVVLSTASLRGPSIGAPQKTSERGGVCISAGPRDPEQVPSVVEIGTVSACCRPTRLPTNSRRLSCRIAAMRKADRHASATSLERDGKNRCKHAEHNTTQGDSRLRRRELPGTCLPARAAGKAPAPPETSSGGGFLRTRARCWQPSRTTHPTSRVGRSRHTIRLPGRCSSPDANRMSLGSADTGHQHAPTQGGSPSSLRAQERSRVRATSNRVRSAPHSPPPAHDRRVGGGRRTDLGKRGTKRRRRKIRTPPRTEKRPRGPRSPVGVVDRGHKAVEAPNAHELRQPLHTGRRHPRVLPPPCGAAPTSTTQRAEMPSHKRVQASLIGHGAPTPSPSNGRAGGAGGG